MVALAVCLLLLPGLLVVRAPWTAVPALSLAFWVVSAVWLPRTTSRAAFVGSVLLGSGLLAALRFLPRHEVPPPPGVEAPRPPAPAPRPGLAPPRLSSGTSWLPLLAAFGLMVPAIRWRHAPGADLAFETIAARLTWWRDGLPASAEPLLPLTPFDAHPPAFSLLAADLSALTGADPAAAVVLVLCAAAGLLPVGLFALHATWLRPQVAAVAATLPLAAVPWPGWVAIWGPGPALLALALALPALGLLVGHASRSSGVAAALLLAAALLAHPPLALVVAAGIVLAIRPAARWRLAGVVGGAFALAAPVLLRVSQAVSYLEWRSRLGRIEAGELLAGLGGALALVLVPLALGRPERRPARGLLWAAAAAAVLLSLRHHVWMAQGQLGEVERLRLEAAARTVGPLEVACVSGTSALWLAALESRGVEPLPWTPFVYADERALLRPRACRPVPVSAP